MNTVWKEENLMELRLQWLFDTHHILRTSLFEYICHVSFCSHCLLFITIYPSFVRNAAAAALRNLHLHTYQKLKILSSTSDLIQIFVYLVISSITLIARTQHAYKTCKSDTCAPQHAHRHTL